MKHPVHSTFLSGATLLCSLVALLLVACGAPKASKYPTQEVYTEDTTLGAGDTFEVRVFRQKDLTAVYSISPQGTIAFPMIGDIVAAGRTPAEVEIEIQKKLEDGFLKNPQVSILVKEYKSKKISVFGQVRKPGTLTFSEGMTVIEAISSAGGFTPMAQKNGVRITRGAATKKSRFTVPVESIGKGKANNFFMRPGDVVFVPERLW